MTKKLLPLLLLLGGLYGAENSAQSQTRFNRPFAPQEGFVATPERPCRDEICLNGRWKFMPVETEGMTPEQLKTQTYPTAPVWDAVECKVPSPWNVNGFSRGGGGDFVAYPSYPEAWEHVQAAWLQKKVRIPAGWDRRRIILHFEAVAGYARVFANGNLVCENFDLFLPFSADVTDYARPGQEIEVTVWVARASLFDEPGKYGKRPYIGGSFWGNHIAGIWQDVFLLSYPEVYIADTYIDPDVAGDRLSAELTILNTTGKPQRVALSADVRRWHNDADTSALSFPVPAWHLDDAPALDYPVQHVTLAPGENKVTLQGVPDGRLEKWSPANPALYGMTVSMQGRKGIADRDYTRFGWRQFRLKGTRFYLNDEVIELKGDSWHFMGIPQMTRRYAYSWYRMLRDANANAVRLHAQVFPRFYLDMADEMGICVLDETAMWSSDGGPKVDAEAFWQACRDHVRGMVLRDRNHPSVFGWSVCNEMLAVTKHVVHAPEPIVERNIAEINEWVRITRECDHTRNWISGDGETQTDTDLPTVIGHYCNTPLMLEWKSKGKPWGVGEMGMCYAGTPAHVSVVNGDRAFESQEGRMEGLAGEAFETISMQRGLDACYASIFNLAWYGVQPLEIGLEDITRPVKAEDGIWFGPYREGGPGVQPERLGPYTTTFNPGYDPRLPLYRPWALFEGVKAAFSDTYAALPNKWAVRKHTEISEPVPAARDVVWISADPESKAERQFEELSVAFRPLDTRRSQLILLDGIRPAEDPALVERLRAALGAGSTLLVWNISPAALPLVEKLGGHAVTLTPRNAASYIIRGKHSLLNGQDLSTLYFNERTKEPVSSFVMTSGDAYATLLDPCNTDWSKWNYQEENIKTGQVLRSERESKPLGSVLLRGEAGRGELLLSAIDPFVLGNKGSALIHEMLHNLGARFNGRPRHIPAALDRNGTVVHALLSGTYAGGSMDEVMARDYLEGTPAADLRPGAVTSGRYWGAMDSNEEGFWNFETMNLKGEQKDCAVYLSFWLFSPRSLVNLLLEPNMPRLDLEFAVDDKLAVYVNSNLLDNAIKRQDNPALPQRIEGIPLEKGWNHVLLKVGQLWGGWNGRFRFTATDPAYMRQLESVIMQ